MVGLRFCERVRGRVGPDRVDLVVYGEEPRPAYDRVHLSDFFSGTSAEDLEIVPRSWYDAHDISLRTGDRVVSIDRTRKVVTTQSGVEDAYDELVLATGSIPFVPAIPGRDREGVFVYRTIEDLTSIREWGRTCRSGAVLGGGLLGLEAAKALLDLGLETHVVEFMPRLMPQQLDEGGAAALRTRLEALGLHVLTGRCTEEIAGNARIEALRFAGGEALEVDMLVVSAGIRPRDDLARASGLAVGERGGVVVDDALRTSDPSILAIGEAALHRGMIYGLVAPGYEMADVAADHLAGDGSKSFPGADLSTTLKLIGVEVASFGASAAPADDPGEAIPIVFEDRLKGVYRRISLSPDGTRLLGGVLVGDTSAYGILHQMYLNDMPCPENPEDLILGARGGSSANGGAGVEALPEDARICSCENVSKGTIESAIRQHELTEVRELTEHTGAGSGCGGCAPLLSDLLRHALASNGGIVRNELCEHFAYTRQELYDLIRVRDIRSFDGLLAEYGTGHGCEVCKPAIASLMASVHAQIATDQDTIQDTNDRFLANLQRGGTYSVVPRVPGGEISPAQLKVIAEVAERYDLYTKITGGQRIDMFGARVEELPEIWAELVAAGFESGHAYGKALRTVKSCVGSTWCRYGVQDAVGFAIRVENRYKGIRAPHKLKSAVSGCLRECAEARSKDFGMIATERGWNLYVGGNGGSSPQHARLLAADLDEEECIRMVDRFLMFYIRTAEPLTRTSRWLNQLEGGMDYLRAVIIEDSLGICAELEGEMAKLVEGYACEWRAVVESAELQARFRPFVNTPEPDPSIRFLPVRAQKQPAH